ncbi:MAG: divergent polysaccharide deacetylase family protein [Rhizobiaceae bacterium]|nr:divergent polysaccharide deacetylase family protein [Rhizobiaceae bacterium]
MSPVNKDIDQPLGQSQKLRNPGKRRYFPSGAAGLAGICGIALIAASVLISTRDQGLRKPEPSVVSTPVVAEAVPASEIPAPKPTDNEPATVGSIGDGKTKSGPSIIKVDPTAGDSGKGVIVIRDPSAVGQDLLVAHLPDRDLLEDSPAGKLPVRAADGRRPFDVYARPWSGARGARVAIVIGGLGLSQTGTQAAIASLPAEVTLAFAPQGNSLDRWMQAARRKGHELVLQLPMEPFDYPNVNPGRDTLTVDGSAGQNEARLHSALARITNYTGVMNYMGARFVADKGAMEPLMEELGARGLLYLDDGTTARSTASDLALRNRVPFAVGNAIIDANRDRGSILKKLDELERTARAQGFALGTGSAFDATVDAVNSWVAEARKRGIEIVPVSAVAVDPERG